ncbi:unnamed protein product [Amoebophrya sp. A25]|nr:unnamed protein product [Amoebophrya sp. A25]|eukprot:GSA25T00005901001.1
MSSSSEEYVEDYLEEIPLEPLSAEELRELRGRPFGPSPEPEKRVLFTTIVEFTCLNDSLGILGAGEQEAQRGDEARRRSGARGGEKSKTGIILASVSPVESSKVYSINKGHKVSPRDLGPGAGSSSDQLVASSSDGKHGAFSSLAERTARSLALAFSGSADTTNLQHEEDARGESAARPPQAGKCQQAIVLEDRDRRFVHAHLAVACPACGARYALTLEENLKYRVRWVNPPPPLEAEVDVDKKVVPPQKEDGKISRESGDEVKQKSEETEREKVKVRASNKTSEGSSHTGRSNDATISTGDNLKLSEDDEIISHAARTAQDEHPFEVDKKAPQVDKIEIEQHLDVVGDRRECEAAGDEIVGLASVLLETSSAKRVTELLVDSLVHESYVEKCSDTESWSGSIRWSDLDSISSGEIRRCVEEKVRNLSVEEQIEAHGGQEQQNGEDSEHNDNVLQRAASRALAKDSAVDLGAVEGHVADNRKVDDARPRENGKKHDNARNYVVSDDVRVEDDLPPGPLDALFGGSIGSRFLPTVGSSSSVDQSQQYKAWTTNADTGGGQTHAGSSSYLQRAMPMKFDGAPGSSSSTTASPQQSVLREDIKSLAKYFWRRQRARGKRRQPARESIVVANLSSGPGENSLMLNNKTNVTSDATQDGQENRPAVISATRSIILSQVVGHGVISSKRKTDDTAGSAQQKRVGQELQEKHNDNDEVVINLGDDRGGESPVVPIQEEKRRRRERRADNREFFDRRMSLFRDRSNSFEHSEPEGLGQKRDTSSNPAVGSAKQGQPHDNKLKRGRGKAKAAPKVSHMFSSRRALNNDDLVSDEDSDHSSNSALDFVLGVVDGREENANDLSRGDTLSSPFSRSTGTLAVLTQAGKSSEPFVYERGHLLSLKRATTTIGDFSPENSPRIPEKFLLVSDEDVGDGVAAAVGGRDQRTPAERRKTKAPEGEGDEDENQLHVVVEEIELEENKRKSLQAADDEDTEPDRKGKNIPRGTSAPATIHGKSRVSNRQMRNAPFEAPPSLVQGSPPSLALSAFSSVSTSSLLSEDFAAGGTASLHTLPKDAAPAEEDGESCTRVLQSRTISISSGSAKNARRRRGRERDGRATGGLSPGPPMKEQDFLSGPPGSGEGEDNLKNSDETRGDEAVKKSGEVASAMLQRENTRTSIASSSATSLRRMDSLFDATTVASSRDFLGFMHTQIAGRREIIARLKEASWRRQIHSNNLVRQLQAAGTRGPTATSPARMVPKSGIKHLGGEGISRRGDALYDGGKTKIQKIASGAGMGSPSFAPQSRSATGEMKQTRAGGPQWQQCLIHQPALEREAWLALRRREAWLWAAHHEVSKFGEIRLFQRTLAYSRNKFDVLRRILEFYEQELGYFDFRNHQEMRQLEITYGRWGVIGMGEGKAMKNSPLFNDPFKHLLILTMEVNRARSSVAESAVTTTASAENIQPTPADNVDNDSSAAAAENKHAGLQTGAEDGGQSENKNKSLAAILGTSPDDETESGAGNAGLGEHYSADSPPSASSPFLGLRFPTPSSSSTSAPASAETSPVPVTVQPPPQSPGLLTGGFAMSCVTRDGKTARPLVTAPTEQQQHYLLRTRKNLHADQEAGTAPSYQATQFLRSGSSRGEVSISSASLRFLSPRGRATLIQLLQRMRRCLHASHDALVAGTHVWADEGTTTRMKGTSSGTVRGRSSSKNAITTSRGAAYKGAGVTSPGGFAPASGLESAEALPLKSLSPEDTCYLFSALYRGLLQEAFRYWDQKYLIFLAEGDDLDALEMAILTKVEVLVSQDGLSILKNFALLPEERERWEGSRRTSPFESCFIAAAASRPAPADHSDEPQKKKTSSNGSSDTLRGKKSSNGEVPPIDVVEHLEAATHANIDKQERSSTSTSGVNKGAVDVHFGHAISAALQATKLTPDASPFDSLAASPLFASPVGAATPQRTTSGIAEPVFDLEVSLESGDWRPRDERIFNMDRVNGVGLTPKAEEAGTSRVSDLQENEPEKHSKDNIGEGGQGGQDCGPEGSSNTSSSSAPLSDGEEDNSSSASASLLLSLRGVPPSESGVSRTSSSMGTVLSSTFSLSLAAQLSPTKAGCIPAEGLGNILVAGRGFTAPMALATYARGGTRTSDDQEVVGLGGAKNLNRPVGGAFASPIFVGQQEAGTHFSSNANKGLQLGGAPEQQSSAVGPCGHTIKSPANVKNYQHLLSGNKNSVYNNYNKQLQHEETAAGAGSGSGSDPEATPPLADILVKHGSALLAVVKEDFSTFLRAPNPVEQSIFIRRCLKAILHFLLKFVPQLQKNYKVVSGDGTSCNLPATSGGAGGDSAHQTNGGHHDHLGAGASTLPALVGCWYVVLLQFEAASVHGLLRHLVFLRAWLELEYQDFLLEERDYNEHQGSSEGAKRFWNTARAGTEESVVATEALFAALLLIERIDARHIADRRPATQLLTQFLRI